MFKFKCGQTRTISALVTPGQTKVRTNVWYCKSWNCDKCRQKKAKNYAKRTFDIFAGEKVRFFTVTMDRHLSRPDAWREISSCWNRFRTAFVKRYGKTKFVRVLEPQPNSDYPHYHILINRYIPASWLQRELKSAGFGKIYDIRYITSMDAFNYVLKYLKKGWPKGMGSRIATEIGARRYNTSRENLPKKTVSEHYKLLGFAGNPQLALLGVDNITRILAERGVLHVRHDTTGTAIFDSYSNVFASGCSRRSELVCDYTPEEVIFSYLARVLHGIRHSSYERRPGALDWREITRTLHGRGFLA